ncbi:hypothetical protein [uncultured Erythrobacter sp.]|uniref:hypothetical protein n=1 Tax=uncultured Erythrobacter sp. TaxID=263913 RepID=UPI00261E255F|nr:hypothetical protein [uncultured Erythrobacter sp.]
MTKRRPDRLTKQLAKASEEDAQSGNLTIPSPNPATNLLIADILVRGASTMFRQNIEQRVAKASADNEEQAQELLDGRTLLTTLALYGASKLATKSPVGLGIVAGGLVLKTLYDRGKSVQLGRKRSETEEE